MSGVTRAGPLDVMLNHADYNKPMPWTQLDADLVEIGDAQRPGRAMADCSMGIVRGQPATPDDIVGTALYLASSDSDYLTGQVVMIDGGMVLV